MRVCDSALHSSAALSTDASDREWIETGKGGETKRTLIDLPRIHLAPGERLES